MIIFHQAGRISHQPGLTLEFTPVQFQYSFSYQFLLYHCNYRYSIQFYSLGQLGQRIITTLRSELFESYLRRDMSYFDLNRNSVDVLTTRLHADTRIVHEATGESFANQLQAVSAMAIGLLISCIASWKIALIVLGAISINMAGTKSFVNINDYL